MGAVLRKQWRRVRIGRVALVGLAALGVLAAGQSEASATAPPTTTVTSGPPKLSNQTQAQFYFRASATKAIFFCSLDGATATRCTSPQSYQVGSGPHVFSVSAKTTTSAKGPATNWSWTATGAGEGYLNPWGIQVENKQSNFAPVAPHQALLDAQRFNYIIAHPIAYQGMVTAMKQANPRLKLFVYLSGTFSQPTDASLFASDDFLYDAHGNKVHSPFGTYLMNPTKSDWLNNRIATCQAFLAESGYDGCYLDTLGLVAVGGTFVSAPPINPSTGNAWTPSDWIAATSTLAGQIRTAMSPAPVFGNGLTGGINFYSTTSPTKPLVDAMNGGIAEAWIRGSVVPVNGYPPESVWLENVKMIGVVEAEQKPLLTLTKVHVSATQAQLSQWAQYTLASFLLGTGGLSAFTFSPGQTVDRMSDYPYYHIALGAPTGSYTSSGGVYQRTFLDGLVLVNPTKSSAAVTLPQAYYNSTGTKVTKVSMGAESGMVLTAYPEPTTTITSQPAVSTTSTSATVAFSSTTAGVTFDCQVDSSTPAPCTSPLSLSGLSEAPHTVSVQAVTSTGVVGPAALAAWTVDIHTPTTTILSAPPSSIPASSPSTFTFSANKPGVIFTCSLDGATPALCTPGAGLAPTLAAPLGWTMTYTGLAVGSHTLSIYATDAYGLVGPTVSDTWSTT